MEQHTQESVEDRNRRLLRFYDRLSARREAIYDKLKARYGEKWQLIFYNYLEEWKIKLQDMKNNGRITDDEFHRYVSHHVLLHSSVNQGMLADNILEEEEFSGPYKDLSVKDFYDRAVRDLLEQP